jgi:hypothetical protein
MPRRPEIREPAISQSVQPYSLVLSPPLAGGISYSDTLLILDRHWCPPGWIQTIEFDPDLFQLVIGGRTCPFVLARQILREQLIRHWII